MFLPLVPLSILASALGLVVRFRRSSGVERLQLKWLTFAGALVALLYGVTMLATLVGTSRRPDRTPAAVTALQTLSLVAFVLLPVAIGIAILRHRLFDIDVVINRTLVYGALTVTLGAFYLGSVLLLRFLVSPFTGDSDLAVAGSTLAVAALFRPARAHGSSRWSTGGSTDAATTPRTPWTPSAPGCGTSSTSTRSASTCGPRSPRRCSRRT